MIEQFKTINDLSAIIKEYEGILARPTRRLSHPTLYRNRDVGKHEKVIKGVRVKDWFLSEDEKWALPHDQMGLSFSSTYKNLKEVYKLKGKHNPGSSIDIYWVLEKADIPTGLKFEQDRSKKGHYFLTVTHQMLLSTLVNKLKLIAHRMSVIKDAGRAL